jgi:hypothetical protein
MRPQPTITALQRAADRVVFFNVLSGRANYMSLVRFTLGSPWLLERASCGDVGSLPYCWRMLRWVLSRGSVNASSAVILRSAGGVTPPYLLPETHPRLLLSLFWFHDFNLVCYLGACAGEERGHQSGEPHIDHVHAKA